MNRIGIACLFEQVLRFPLRPYESVEAIVAVVDAKEDQAVANSPHNDVPVKVRDAPDPFARGPERSVSYG